MDQMVDRWLFSDWMEAEISAVSRTSTRAGWAPFPEGYFDFRNTFRGRVFATDCRSFDWTFPDWLVPLLVKLRLDQCKWRSAGYDAAVSRRYEEVLGRRCVVRLPSGRRFRQCVGGIMKSGWLRTISDNSAAQYLLNAIAWGRLTSRPFPTLWAMGDDVIMDWPDRSVDVEQFVTELGRLGVVIKSFDHDRSFAGFRFERDNGVDYVTPCYPGKHRFLLNHYAGDPEIIIAYSLLYSMARDSEITSFLDARSRITRRCLRNWAQGLVKCETLAACPPWL